MGQSLQRAQRFCEARARKLAITPEQEAKWEEEGRQLEERHMDMLNKVQQKYDELK